MAVQQHSIATLLDKYGRIRIRMLCAFVAVYEADSSCRRGGEICNLSTNTISTGLHNLENILQVELFRYAGRGKSLSPADFAHELYPVAKNICSTLNHRLSGYYSVSDVVFYILLARVKSIGQASRLMGFSVSNGIEKINTIESWTGNKLFNRNGRRGVNLTMEGYAYLKKSIKVVESIDTIEQLLLGLNDKIQVKL